MEQCRLRYRQAAVLFQRNHAALRLSVRKSRCARTLSVSEWRLCPAGASTRLNSPCANRNPSTISAPTDTFRQLGKCFAEELLSCKDHLSEALSFSIHECTQREAYIITSRQANSLSPGRQPRLGAAVSTSKLNNHPRPAAQYEMCLLLCRGSLVRNLSAMQQALASMLPTLAGETNGCLLLARATRGRMFEKFDPSVARRKRRKPWRFLHFRSSSQSSLRTSWSEYAGAREPGRRFSIGLRWKDVR